MKLGISFYRDWEPRGVPAAAGKDSALHRAWIGCLVVLFLSTQVAPFRLYGAFSGGLLRALAKLQSAACDGCHGRAFPSRHHAALKGSALAPARSSAR